METKTQPLVAPCSPMPRYCCPWHLGGQLKRHLEINGFGCLRDLVREFRMARALGVQVHLLRTPVKSLCIEITRLELGQESHHMHRSESMMHQNPTGKWGEEEREGWDLVGGVRPLRPAHPGAVPRGARDHAREALAHLRCHAR